MPAALTGTRQRFLKKTLDSFRRHGAELDAAGKSKLAEIDVELSKATTKFSENVLDSTNAFELLVTDESKLAGLTTERGGGRAPKRGIEGAGRLAVHSAGAELYASADISGRPRKSVSRFTAPTAPARQKAATTTESWWRASLNYGRRRRRS